MDSLVDGIEQWLRTAAGEPVREQPQVANHGTATDAAKEFRAAALVAAKRRSSSKEPAAQQVAAPHANPDVAGAEAENNSAEANAPTPAGAAPAVASAFSLDLGSVVGSFWEPVYAKPRKTPRGAQSTREENAAAADGAANSEASAGGTSPKKRANLSKVGSAAHASVLLNKKRPASARLPFSGGSKASAPDATRPATARESRSPTRRPSAGAPAAGGARLASQSQSPSRSPTPQTRRKQATAALLQSAGGLGAPGAGDSRGASPSTSPAGLRSGAAVSARNAPAGGAGGAAALSTSQVGFQSGTSSTGRPFFGDRPTAPFRDAFMRKPRPKEKPRQGKPSPSSFVHPSTTPLTSVQSAVRPLALPSLPLTSFALRSVHIACLTAHSCLARLPLLAHSLALLLTRAAHSPS